MTVSYSVVSFFDCADQLENMAVDHHAEVNVFDDVQLDISWARYFAAEASGHYLQVAAKIEDKLVGWVGFFMYDHMRHKGYKIAKEDWYYVAPDFRGKGVGKGLFEFAEESLKEMGVRRVMVSCKVEHDHTGLIESMGYENHEKNFTKVLA